MEIEYRDFSVRGKVPRTCESCGKDCTAAIVFSDRTTFTRASFLVCRQCLETALGAYPAPEEED